MILYFIILCMTFRINYSFHINYKIISKKDSIKNNIKNIYTVNHLYKLYTVKSHIKNKLSFFSGFYNEPDKYKLNEEENEYLKKICVSENDNYAELMKKHEEYLSKINDIKSKLKYKDLFFFILQKLIHKSLYEFKQKQKYNFFNNDKYTSELSIDYVKSSNIHEKFKDELIKKLNDENKKKFFLFKFFKLKSISEIYNISKLMIPFSLLGLFFNKFAIFSIAVNIIITAHFLTFKDNQKHKMKISNLILTIFPILSHSLIGLICNHLFFKYIKITLPIILKKENILSLFVNMQLYLASLIYFTNDTDEINTEYNDIESDNISTLTD